MFLRATLLSSMLSRRMFLVSTWKSRDANPSSEGCFLLNLPLGKVRVATEKRPYHHGDLAAALKEAALGLIAEKGVSGFNLRDAARAAGVSHAAPYRHFADRDELLAAIAEDGFRGILEAFVEAAEKHPGDPLARFLEIGGTFMLYGISHPEHFRLMYGPSSPDRDRYPAIRELDLASYQLAIDAIADAQREGTLREGNPRELGALSFAILYGATSAYLDGQLGRMGFADADVEKVLLETGNIALEGLLPRSDRKND